MTAVLRAIESGAGSLTEAARRAEVSYDEADAIVETLIDLGRLRREAIAIGCPSGGCGTCGSASGCHPAGHRDAPTLLAIRPVSPRPGGPSAQ